MPDDAGRIANDFDHNSPAHAKEWPREFQELLEHNPRVWSEKHGGFWIATKYKDILKICQSKDAFTSNKIIDRQTGATVGGAGIPSIPGFRMSPQETENPEWANVRNFLNRRFAPKAMEDYRGKLKQWVAALLDRVIETGRIEFVSDLASPLPALMTMDMLGFPLGEWRLFSDLFHDMSYVSKDDPKFAEVAHKMGVVIRERTDEELDKRLTQPRDDIFTAMVSGTVGGAPMERQMMHDITFMVLGGGVDTTTSLVACTLVYLARNPQERQRLIDDPALMPYACEEFVRYFTPVHANARTVKHDVNVDGWEFKAGQRLNLAWSSANRDPEVFEDPEKIKLDRFPNRHIGFGMGPHRCLGSFMARILFEVMITEVLTRMPDYKMIDSEVEPYESVAFINGLIKAPATFVPGKKVGAAMPA